jgi:hypothetical protein
MMSHICLDGVVVTCSPFNLRFRTSQGKQKSIVKPEGPCHIFMACKRTFSHDKKLVKAKLYIIFRSPQKLPTLLLDTAVVAQLWRPLIDKSGDNSKLLNPTEVHISG